jgi:hypothetical protein
MRQRHTITEDSTMIRTPPGHAPTVKSLDQQKTDFTSEGAPPAGKAGTANHAPADPAMPPLPTASGTGRASAPIGVAGKSKPELPHERDEAISLSGAVASAPMEQAYRDLAHGLKDTDRGAEAGRTYKKLKQ